MGRSKKEPEQSGIADISPSILCHLLHFFFFFQGDNRMSTRETNPKTEGRVGNNEIRETAAGGVYDLVCLFLLFAMRQKRVLPIKPSCQPIDKIRSGDGFSSFAHPFSLTLLLLPLSTFGICSPLVFLCVDCSCCHHKMNPLL